MKKDITVEGFSKFFKIGFGNIRTITTSNPDVPDGSVAWFSGLDIAKALGYANPSTTLSENVKPVHKRTFKPADINSSRTSDITYSELQLNNRGETFITFQGVIHLVMRSILPEAETFQDWIIEEVIPQLYHHGRYLDKDTENALADLCRTLREVPAPSVLEIADQVAAILKMDSRAYTYGRIAMASPGSCSVTDFAKELSSKGYKTGPNDFLSWLRMMGYFCNHGVFRNKPYQAHIDNELFEMIDVLIDVDGKERMRVIPYITPKGKGVIAKEYAETYGKPMTSMQANRDQDGFYVLTPQPGSFAEEFMIAYIKGKGKEYFLKHIRKCL